MKLIRLLAMFIAITPGLQVQAMQSLAQEMGQITIRTTDDQAINVDPALVELSSILKERTSNEIDAVCSAEQLKNLIELMRFQHETTHDLSTKLNLEILDLLANLRVKHADNRGSFLCDVLGILKQANAWQLTTIEKFLRYHVIILSPCTLEEYSQLPKADVVTACGIVPIKCENQIFLFPQEIVLMFTYLQVFIQRAPDMAEAKAEVLIFSNCSLEQLVIIKKYLETVYFYQSLCRPKLSLQVYGYYDPQTAATQIEEKIQHHIVQYIRSLPTISFDLIYCADKFGLSQLTQLLVNEMSLPDGEVEVPENLCWYFYNRLPWSQENVKTKLEAFNHGLQREAFLPRQVKAIIDELLNSEVLDTVTNMLQLENQGAFSSIKQGLIHQFVGDLKTFEANAPWGGDLSQFNDKLNLPARTPIGATINVPVCLMPILSMEYLNDNCCIITSTHDVYCYNQQTGQVQELKLLAYDYNSAVVRTWDNAYVIIKYGIITKVFFFPEYAPLSHLFGLLKNNKG